MCNEHKCDPLCGLDFLGFCSMINKPVGRDQLWLSTQDLLRVTLALRAKTSSQDLRPPSTGSGAPNHAGSRLEPATRYAEALSDSDSDYADDEIAAALQRALAPEPQPAAKAFHPARADPAPPPSARPDTDTADRLARYFAREPCDTSRLDIRSLRDAFGLPSNIVLALVLADPSITRYVCDGSSLFQTCLHPALNSRRWANLVDMLDPLARTTAETMLGSPSHRGLALHLINL